MARLPCGESAQAPYPVNNQKGATPPNPQSTQASLLLHKMISGLSHLPNTFDRPLERWIAAGSALVCCAGMAYLLVIVWAGSSATWTALQQIGAGILAIGMAACGLSLLVRFSRWQLILAQLGHRLPTGFSLRVYLAGMALSATPAKLGETMRSALLLARGVPARHSLGGFVADRLSDLIGVAALGAAAAALAGRRQPVLEAVAALAVVGAAVGARCWQASTGASRPATTRSRGAVGRWLALAGAPIRAWAEAWRGWRPLAYSAFAVLAYGIQALIFAAYLARVAPAIGTADGVAIFSSATLIGAATLVPGGLGAMDSALVLQLQSRGVGLPEALAVALAARASTLWLTWLIGLGALLSFVGMRPRRATQPAQDQGLA